MSSTRSHSELTLIDLPFIDEDHGLRALADCLPQLVWISSPDGTPLFVNRRWRTYTGVLASPLDAAEWLLTIHPNDAAHAVSRWQHSLQTGAPYEVELRLRRHDGAHRWFLARAEAERSVQGAIRRWHGTFTDIDSIRSTYDLPRLRALMNCIRDEIWFLDAQGRHLEVNTAGREAFGLRADDSGDAVRFRQGLEVLRVDGSRRSPEDAPSLRALRGEVVENEEYFLRMPITGELQRRQVTATPVRDADGAIVGSLSVVRDVTAKRRSEEALRAGEGRHRLLAETMLHGVVHQNIAGEIIAMNPAAERILGRTREQIMGSTSVRLEHHTIREDGSPFPGNEHPAMEALRTGLPVHDRVMGVFNPQRAAYRWIRVDAVPLGTKDGARPTEVYAVFEDITERREAEEQLRKSRAQLHAALRSMTDAVCISDAEGRFVEFNDAFAAFHRFENKEQCAQTFAQYPDILDVFTPDGRPAAVDEWAVPRALRGETITNVEYTLRRKDTGDSWIGNYAFAPIRDGAGTIVGSVVTARDVTERHRAEVALRESEARLRLALEAAQAGIWESWPSTGAFLASERALELHGLPPGTVMDVAAAMIQIHPEDRPHVDAALAATLATGAPYRVEIRAVQPDGSIRWLVSHAELQRSATDPKLVGLVQDITERKLTEEALRVADRQKDEFLAMLAHELRNPLAPIRSATEILARILADSPATLASVSTIRRQTHVLTRLVDDLLDVARIAQGRIELRQEHIAATAIVQQAVETVSPLISAKRHRLHVEVDAALYVQGDPARLAQCLCNVLHNAAKYTDPAGDLWLTAHADGDSAVFEVRDNGHGITADLLPRVFELFVQSKRTLDRSEGGLGVGLSLVKRLIELHGGMVTVASDGVDRGATFKLALPRVDPAAAPAVPQASKSPARRVLIVDDNVDAADSLAMLLRFDGHEVETAYTAAAALETAVRVRPEIIFLDIGLPEMDGYEVARRLRSIPELGRVRLVALTGYGRSTDRELTRAAGFDAHCVKPIDFDAIAAIIATGPLPQPPSH